MNTWIRWIGIAVALMVAWPAAAQHPPGPGGRRMQPPPAQRQFQPPPQRQFQPPGRESGSDDRRGRMTPEERQQLRRDINQHGREVYREPLRR